MVRLTEIDDILFPVEERPLLVSVRDGAGERSVPVPQNKAIVNGATGRVLGVVSREYRLVTNRQALDWGHECCRTVFPDTKSSEWHMEVTDAPSSGGHCYIDLVHNSTALDFRFVAAKDKPDLYGPFIRVTNSYNRLRALRYDVGFYRKVCKNGLILPDALLLVTGLVEKIPQINLPTRAAAARARPTWPCCRPQ